MTVWPSTSLMFNRTFSVSRNRELTPIRGRNRIYPAPNNRHQQAFCYYTENMAVTSTSANGRPTDRPSQISKKHMDTGSLEELQTDEQRRIFDALSQVRKCGLESVLSLPQLVVCGDQWAGESSVLEGLTEIPFPRNDNLCTLFARIASTSFQYRVHMVFPLLLTSNHVQHKTLIATSQRRYLHLLKSYM
jgi:hypothetical protein